MRIFLFLSLSLLVWGCSTVEVTKEVIKVTNTVTEKVKKTIPIKESEEETVIEEIEYWINKGRYHFFCHDSIINGDPRWLKKFCETIIEKGWPEEYGMTFGGNVRLQTPMRDLETMRLYRKAGLMKMITGFEKYFINPESTMSE